MEQLLHFRYHAQPSTAPTLGHGREILKLRKDMETKLGKDFDLMAFHDGFMKQGFAPIQIVRKTMLGDDPPTL